MDLLADYLPLIKALGAILVMLIIFAVVDHFTRD